MSAKPEYPEYLFEELPPDPPKKKAPARTVNADAGNMNQKQSKVISPNPPTQVESPQTDTNKSESEGGGLQVNPAKILKLLGVDAVLLPIRRGTKRPSRKE